MKHRIPLLVSVAVFILSCAAFARQESNMVVGNVRVVKVEGSAWQIMAPSGQRERLKEGDFLRQGNTVVTDANSTVWLLFQNGSTINLQPRTRFSIAEFLLDPFETERVDYRNISSEPSRSVTKVEVKEGTITAKIPKLQRSSNYRILTPVASAGIRGTVVTVSVNPNAATFVVTEGSVQVTKGGQTFFAGGDAGQGDTRTVSAGNQQDVTVSSDPNYTPPAGQSQGLAQQAQQFAASVNQSIPQNPFAGAPPQTGPGGQTPPGQNEGPTEGDNPNFDGPSDGSAPALPGGFGGGGGGGGGGSSGGGGQYSR